MWVDSQEAGGAPSTACRWYAVYSRPHAEKRAAIHLARQGFRPFLPLYVKTIRHARQFRTVRAPFFSRYLFVELDLGRDRWRSVTGTFGVSHMIMEGDTPKPVPTGVVEALLGTADADGLVKTEATLQPGQPVRIGNGPFAGMVATLVALDDDQRVAVLLDILGTKTKVAFDASEVSLLPA
jgi:transcription elongation factor/antiterminator RfaH